MKRVAIREAKTNLARLVRRACLGEEIVIVTGKSHAVRLAPIREGRRCPRKLGILKGKLFVGPGFFESLPPEELKFW
jgi:antitoxin (DNA-binding transcriptional repressor) of toxin-antitoxin stability system